MRARSEPARTCLLLVLAGLLGAGAQAGEFKSARGFSLTYPEGWCVATKEQRDSAAGHVQSALPKLRGFDLDKLAVLILNPNSADVVENVNVVVTPGATPINARTCTEVSKQITAQLTSSGLQCRDVTSSLIKVRDRDAISSHWTARAPGQSAPIRQWQVVVSGRTRTYVVTCTGPAAGYDRLEPLFADIVNSLEIRPDEPSFRDSLPPVARGAILCALIGAALGAAAAIGIRVVRRRRAREMRQPQRDPPV